MGWALGSLHPNHFGNLWCYLRSCTKSAQGEVKHKFFGWLCNTDFCVTEVCECSMVVTEDICIKKLSIFLIYTLQKSPYVPQHQKANEDREIKPHFPGLGPKSSIKSWFSLYPVFFSSPSVSRELAPLLCETIISEYRSAAVINLLWFHYAPSQLHSHSNISQDTQKILQIFQISTAQHQTELHGRAGTGRSLRFFPAQTTPGFSDYNNALNVIFSKH